MEGNKQQKPKGKNGKEITSKSEIVPCLPLVYLALQITILT